MKYLLGIDFGGGASKATLIDTEGTIIAENTVEYPTLYPSAGACEHKMTFYHSRGEITPHTHNAIDINYFTEADISCETITTVIPSSLISLIML